VDRKTHSEFDVAGADAVTLGNLDQIKNQYSLFSVSAVPGHIV